MMGKERGDWGEARVAEYLRAQGCALLAANYRCRFGEIDLIARDGDMLCFVEVKLRDRVDYGLPREFVTATKQRRLRLTAQHYLATHNPDALCRFDVAEVYTDRDFNPAATRVVYLKNAF
ncbi:MAG: YraN family protein [Oscillospiraceae bacterium]|nr:YraN family protein [Oscillospiraceae bacterium]